MGISQDFVNDYELERIALLQERDLDRWIELARFMCRHMISGTAIKKTFVSPTAQRPVTQERLVKAACAVGDHLCLRAIQHENMAVWMGPTFTRGEEWTLQPVEIDWYDGITGIALFLGYISYITGKQEYRDLARMATQSVRFKIEQYVSKRKITRAGRFSALRSAIHLFAHLGSLWEDLTLFQEAEALVERLVELIEYDKQLDILSGSAGAITSLLGLYSMAPSIRTLEVARLCGEHLLAKAYAMKHGKGWYTTAASAPVTGFSHGAAGIAYSLFWLAFVSKDVRFHHMALEGLAYERGLFSSVEQNWPDLRQIKRSESRSEERERRKFLSHWCHGAPGIGLARLACLPYVDDSQIREEIEAALRATLANGFGRNHSLCHGDFGNLETLLTASCTFYPGYQVQVEQITAMLLESIETSGWVCGVPLGTETPGLMTGLAGIGYQLLRLAEPGRVPSVLAFAPPYLGK